MGTVGTLPGAMSNIASMRGPAADAQRSKLNKDIRRVNQDVAAGRVQAGAGGSVRRKKGGPRSMGGGGARVFGVVRTVTGVKTDSRNVWTQVDPDNLAASAGKVWAVYDTDGSGELDRAEIRVLVRDWIFAMPEICQVYFNDAITVTELEEDIEFHTDQLVESIFEYADTDNNGSIDKDEWIAFFA